MAYGEIKVDTVTFTDGGIDKSVSISGLVQNPTFSGNITVTGTISGNTVQGQTVSGATVTGTTANFVSGVFTTQISGATITGNVGSFTTITGGTVTLTSGVFASGTAAAPSVSIGTTDNGLYSPGADQVAVATNGTGRLFVDASGNVQIGSSFAGFGNGSGVEIERSTTSTLRLTGNSGVGCEFFNTGSLASIQTRSAIPFTIQTNELERLRITSAGLVGIGTSSPASLLDVNGAGRINGSLLVLAGNRIILNRSALDAYAHSIYSNAGNSLTFDAGVGGTGSTLMTLTDSGRLGIGTTSPGSALEVKAAAPVLTVNSAVANASSIVLQENGTTYARFRFDGNNVDIGNLYVNGATIFNAGNAERARIDSSGRLLVGTSTSESSLLQVNAQASASGNAFRSSHQIANSGTGVTQTNQAAPYISYLYGFTAASQVTAIAINGEDFGAGDHGLQLELNCLKSSGAVANGDRLGRIRFGGDDGANIIPAASIDAFVDGTPGANDMPGRLVFSTTADGASSPTERLRITSAGLVGIGTSAPSKKLEIANGDVRLTDGYTISWGDDTYRIFRNGSQLRFDTNGSQALTIDSSQRVGIGTTSVQGNLHSYATGATYCLNLDNNNAGVDQNYIAFSSAEILALVGKLFRPTTTNNLQLDAHYGALSFGTGSAGTATERARIDSSGRLGIGTSSPGESIHTAGKLRVGDGGNYTVAAVQLGASNANGISYPGTNVLNFITDSTAALTIDASQRVGIGTTSPQEELHIASASQPYIQVQSTGGVTGSAYYGYNSSTGSASIESTGSIRFAIPGNEAARIDSSGRLLVGTSTSRSNIGGNTAFGSKLQIESTGTDGLGALSLINNYSSGYPAALTIGKSAGSAIGSNNIVANGEDIAQINFVGADGANLVRAASIVAFVDGTPGANDMPGRLVFSTTADGASSPTEACRITSNQDLLLSQSGSGIFVGTTVDGAFRIGRSSFAVSTGTLYIGNAAIQVSSDIRLKDNIQDTSLNALEAISKIKVKDFTWSDPSDTSYNNRNARGKWTGLIAQELVDVLPFVVNAPRKEEDGSIDHDSDSIWTLDQSQLCPVLIKAVQQQQEIITALEARLTAAGI
jgi:hypothetical protein